MGIVGILGIMAFWRYMMVANQYDSMGNHPVYWQR